MENLSRPIVCLSGNPTEDEVTAIALAVMSLQSKTVETSGDKSAKLGDYWGLSSKFQSLEGLKYSGLAGQTSNFQHISRLRARY